MNNFLNKNGLALLRSRKQKQCKIGPFRPSESLSPVSTANSPANESNEQKLLNFFIFNMNYYYYQKKTFKSLNPATQSKTSQQMRKNKIITEKKFETVSKLKKEKKH